MTTVGRKAIVTWSEIGVLYVAVTIAYAWPLIGSIGTALPHDIGDPGLNAWILWWNAHAVPLTERWWNAPIFHPVAGAFALSETLLSLSVVTTPLLLSGVGAVSAYNVAFLISFPLTALAAHALAHRLTGRHDAALIAGLAFGFNPYRASQMPHIQMLWAMWMPLALLALHRYLEQRRRRDLVIAGICWFLNGLTSGYFLVFFAVLVAVWMLWFARSFRDWIAIGVTFTLASIALAPILIGYAHYQSALGLSRSPDEISTFSADLTALAAASPTVWLPSRWTIEPLPEGELYPGVTILVLTVVTAAIFWRRLKLRRWSWFQIVAAVGGVVVGVAALTAPTAGWQFHVAGVEISLTRVTKALFTALCLLTAAIVFDHRMIAGWRRRSLFLFYAVAAFVMLLFALGPDGRAFGKIFFYQAPYSWLMALPGGHALRVPARFAVLMILCLSQAAALAFSHLTPRGAHRLVVAGVLVLVLLDGWVLDFPLAQVPRNATLTGSLDVNIPIVELPIDDVFTDTATMLRATDHRHPLINGFSGYAPSHYGQLRQALAERDPAVVTALQRFGSFVAVVDRSRDPDEELSRFVRDLPGARWLFRSPLGHAYELPAVTRPPGDERAPRLPIAYVDANVNYRALARMLDEDLTTRWLTDKPMLNGDQVIVVLPQPAELTRLEMDLGEWNLDYPRRLRVELAEEGQNPVTVWEGGTAGAALLGALGDRVRTPVAIDLPPGTVGRRFTLTSLQGHEVFYWSIAEIRAFGRPR